MNKRKQAQIAQGMKSRSLMIKQFSRKKSNKKTKEA